MTVKKAKHPEHKKGAVPQLQKEVDQVSARFFARLYARLADMGIDVDSLDAKAGPDGPPCFQLFGTSYSEWLRSASSTDLPIRIDMPAEPNYCHDCTATLRTHAIRNGVCLVPHTRFEHRRGISGDEMVGVSRSRQVSPGEDCRIPDEIRPIDADGW